LDLSAISPEDRTNQIIYVEKALNNIIGKIPTYMRPPYSSCTVESGCEKQLSDLGYHVAYFNLDTDDYNQKEATLPKQWFKGNLTRTGDPNDPWITISHDIMNFTATDLTEYMLKTLTELGYRAVTIGECLGDPEGNWYRTANGTAYVAVSINHCSRLDCA
jgi:peptidoglycan/xylan/chitin deacetylase (PgdA/CDA1 family)